MFHLLVTSLIVHSTIWAGRVDDASSTLLICTLENCLQSQTQAITLCPPSTLIYNCILGHFKHFQQMPPPTDKVQSDPFPPTMILKMVLVLERYRRQVCEWDNGCWSWCMLMEKMSDFYLLPSFTTADAEHFNQIVDNKYLLLFIIQQRQGLVFVRLFRQYNGSSLMISAL